MSLRKRIENIKNTDYINNINDSNERSFSHFSEPENTNFILQTITLEDLDKMVIDTFDSMFTINSKPLRLINGMIDSVSARQIYPEIFNIEKETFIKPMFIVERSKTTPKGRSNPSFKPSTFVIPTMKPQGLVFEEYIVTSATYYDLTYSFLFISSYKDVINELVEQVRFYFRNKRNIVNLHNERFTIKPESNLEDLFIEEEIDEADKPKEYTLEFSLVLEGYTRKEDSTQKRQRPNTYSVEFRVHNGKDNDGSKTIIDKQEYRIKYPSNKKGTKNI